MAGKRGKTRKSMGSQVADGLWYVLRANHQSKSLRIYAYRANDADWASVTQLLPETIRLGAEYESFDTLLHGRLRLLDDTMYWHRGVDRFHLPTQAAPDILAQISQEGRLLGTTSNELVLRPDDCQRLSWVSTAEWMCELSLTASDDSADTTAEEEEEDVSDGALIASLSVRNANDVVAAADVSGIYRENVIWVDDEVGAIADGHEMWVSMLREPVVIEADSLDGFMTRLCSLPELPSFEIDPTLGISKSDRKPTGKVRIEFRRNGEPPYGTVSYAYGVREIQYDDALTEQPIWDPEGRQVLVRDNYAEATLRAELAQLGLQVSTMGWFPIELDDFTHVVRELNRAGWAVFSHGERVRTSSQTPSMTVSSGIDWFELEANVEFGEGYTARLPQLLEAARNRVDFVRLDDGSLGMLPEHYLARFVAASQMAELEDDKLRFGRNQAWLLDALLIEKGEVTTDAKFDLAVQQLATFEGIQPFREPVGFQGELRTYQREGLGWLAFLREFGFGGCLADDMGLGKTIQVLALLEAYRLAGLEQENTASNSTRPPAKTSDDLPVLKIASDGPRHRTSIAVVPASLVFNWIDEASRFTPDLTVVNFTGPQRKKHLASIGKIDLLVTTYGTLRRDILELKEHLFEYAILDEAQAIKNPAALSTKATRLLQANHKLAMTGTPVENRLTDLWSIFEFLNPGMLGPSAKFSKLVSSAPNPRIVTDEDGGAKTTPVENPTLGTLRRALQPFLLRRTKKQVLTELPDKNEQTLYCTMTPAQSRAYKELRDHFRASLKGEIEQLGIGKAKLHVLAALMRLRQVACDPRLLDPAHAGGAKLILLLEQLEEVIASGHKVLVFSQFTSLLALVREQLDARGWTYEYLDGRTRNRKARIDRFQKDDACPLFLISLKAGGHGLNLTAADYVFILDPWWNPAAEAQAIDRAHRIGQTKSVMAYRLICEGTVEEKILELQGAKRSMADAIISANESLLQQISLDDLQLLLS